MLERVLRANTTVRVVHQHLLEEIEALGAEAWHVLAQIFLLVLREISSVALQVLDAGPFVRRGRSHNSKYFQQLVFFVLAGEQRLLGDNLCENAANRPNVDRSVIILRAHKNVGRAIPQRHDLMREVLDWDAESARQTKVGQLKNVVFVDEQVLRLEISMKYFVLVAFGGARKQLVQIRL